MTGRVLIAGGAVMALVGAVIGLLAASATPGDANIGSGLLVLVGLGMLLAGAMLHWVERNDNRGT